ncbi:MarR family transcriptional regulator [Radiobacillus kanasensis]|uniref:MarR family winged helix-turn-helix transcriptional regulator n=1 Tax=Radiobacillus kanasensis TaxID=2844358 RepID=UPI001E4DBC9C|nr:MarR family transcriptional regulator [Radiobacillus kanasensis]UFT98484.1 MarR family transcriptional regulator [Radiobacillus kanasensis]
MNNGEVHQFLNLFRGAYKVIEHDWQTAAQEEGITIAEQHIIWILHLEKEISTTRIAELGLWKLTTVMQVIKRMQQKGLVHTSKNPADKRISFLSLTEKGEGIWKRSQEHELSFVNFLAKYEKESESLAPLLEFLRSINATFHGDEFVHWVEETSKEN